MSIEESNIDFLQECKDSTPSLAEQQKDKRINELHIENQQNRAELKKFAKNFTIAYFVFVATILLLDGCCNFFDEKFFPSEIIITLLGTTTVNVLGLILIIMKYFFKDSNNSSN